MEIIRKITKEITKIKTRMVPEKYEETEMEDCIVIEFTVRELEDLYISRNDFKELCEASGHKLAIMIFLGKFSQNYTNENHSH